MTSFFFVLYRLIFLRDLFLQFHNSISSLKNVSFSLFYRIDQKTRLLSKKDSSILGEVHEPKWWRRWQTAINWSHLTMYKHSIDNSFVFELFFNVFYVMLL
jgi:hypothetical protein